MGEYHDGVTRVLVIEDDQILAQLMQIYLEDEGYRVRTLYDGSHLFNEIEDFQPHLITVDILLPGPDGLHLVRQLRRHPSTQDIPIVFVTALEERRAEGQTLGAEGFVVKPFHRTEFSQAVQHALSVARP